MNDIDGVMPKGVCVETITPFTKTFHFSVQNHIR